ncbi:hypothetical protein CEH78_001503 [Salmonella enterica]|nr:hypothetical protein [Salmonella enterica]
MPDKFPVIKLPVWMNKGDIVRLKNTLTRFWMRVYDWLRWPLRQTDPLTCDERILRLIAWQYDITRFNGEPLSLFRKRVKYAFINAQDSGSVAGFKAIFERLEIGTIEIHERNPGIDWDVILLRLSDGQLARNTALLNQIVRQYGRTCRRYRFQIVLPSDVITECGYVHGGYHSFYSGGENATDNRHFIV